MRNLLVTAVFLAIGLGFSGCETAKKITCNQVPAVSMKAADSVSEAFECQESGLMAEDIEKSLEDKLGCQRDAGLLKEVCKIAVTQAITLIPDDRYTAYKCNLKVVAGKIEPYAKQACELIPDKK